MKLCTWELLGGIEVELLHQRGESLVRSDRIETRIDSRIRKRCIVLFKSAAEPFECRVLFTQAQVDEGHAIGAAAVGLRTLLISFDQLQRLLAPSHSAEQVSHSRGASGIAGRNTEALV